MSYCGFCRLAIFFFHLFFSWGSKHFLNLFLPPSKCLNNYSQRSHRNSNPVSICNWFLQFSSLKYPDWWTCFLVNFTGYSRQKNSLQTRKKIQFIKLDISNWRIAKIKFRYIGCKRFHSALLDQIKNYKPQNIIFHEDFSFTKTLHWLGWSLPCRTFFPSKTIMEFWLISYFWTQVDLKTIVKCF